MVPFAHAPWCTRGGPCEHAVVGDVVGVNMDPSHLTFMGADPLAAIDQLGDAVDHVHASGTLPGRGTTGCCPSSTRMWRPRNARA